MKLRPYQEKAVEECRQAFAQGAQGVCLVSATGSGKTEMAQSATIGSVQKGRRVLFVAHTNELVKQPIERFRKAGLRVGAIAASLPHLRDPGALIQVASIQTLIAREQTPSADLLIYDECHRSKGEVNEAFTRKYSTSKLLGLTATPERGDGAPLGDLFQAIVCGPSIPELTRLGHLAPVTTYAPPKDLGRDFAQSPVDACRQFAQNRSTVVFVPNVERGKGLTRDLVRAGFRADFIDGTTPQLFRDRILYAFNTGRLDVLVNCSVLTEGWDCPRAEVCILARGITTAGLYIQAAGRILRPFPGKQRAILVDLTGKVHRHGFVDDERTYSLTGKAIRTAAELSVTQCPACGACYPAGPAACPACGCVRPAKPLAPPTVTGDPLRDARAAFRAERREAARQPEAIAARIQRKIDAVLARPAGDREYADFLRLKAVADARGYKPGWIGFEFQKLHNRWPAQWLNAGAA